MQMMQIIRRRLAFWSLLGLIGLAVACDGGSSSGGGCDGGSSSGGTSSSGGGGELISIDGTIYDSDLALSGTVHLRDNLNPLIAVTTKSDANGAFHFDLEGKTPPFVIWTTLPSKTGDFRKTLYTTCDGATRVNLSPLTHLVSTMALARDPAVFYRSYPEAGAPDEEAVAGAMAVINDLLALVYADLGIPADFNLMQDPMGDSQTGLRRLLDMLWVYVGDRSYGLYATGTLLQDSDMTDATPAVNAGPEAARAILMGIEAADTYFKLLYTVLQDGAVDADERSQVMQWLAPDFLDSGRGPAPYVDQLAGGMWRVYAEGLRTDEISIFLRMLHGTGDHPVAGLGGISEKGPYESGFWCQTLFEARDCIKLRQIGFVRVNGQWKVYGNRSPFEEELPVRSAGIRLPGDIFFTGLRLGIEDPGHRVQDLGIRKIAVFNAALPVIPNPLGEGSASAVVLAPRRYGALDDTFRIAEPAALADPFLGMFYVTQDGLNLDTLGQDRHFYLVALNADGVPICTWPLYLEESPALVENLRSNAAQLFPTITAIGDAAPWYELPAGVLMAGPAVTWGAPTDEYIHPMEARIEWWNVSAEPYTLAGAEAFQNPAVGDESRLFKDWTAAAFTPPPTAWETQFGLLMVTAYGPLGELYIDAVDFEVLAEPAPGN